MDIQSMTGYGTAESGGIRIEARSTNHKNLYIQVSFPSYLYKYESETRDMIKERFQRGYIEVFFSKYKEDNIKLKINKSFAREYFQALIALKNELAVPGDVGMDILAVEKDIFSLEETEIEISIFREALGAALDELKKARLLEGENLVADIISRIHSLNNNAVRLENNWDEFVLNAKMKLAEKLKGILGNTSIDDSRLIQEVAIMVERTDITEEIVRIKSHLKHMEGIFIQNDVVGKKAGFLIQELQRELNTISSKAPDIKISTLVIEMKYELEKIREQAQNLQ